MLILSHVPCSCWLPLNRDPTSNPLFGSQVSNGGLTEVKEDINDRVSNLDINNTAKPTTPEMTDLPPLKQK